MSSAASYTGGSTGTHGDFSPDHGFVAERQSLFDSIVSRMPTQRGKELSLADRESRGLLRQSSLAYGEMSFAPFALALQKLRDLYGGLEQPNQRFYDLGSGTGKAVVAAALLHAWECCTGIELLHSLHDAALEVLDVWRLPSTQDRLPPESLDVHIEFIRGDCTELDWSDGDVVFINCVVFDEPLMLKLAAIADDMKLGSFVLTCTHRLPSYKWLLLESVVEDMSWGQATVYIQKKVVF